MSWIREERLLHLVSLLWGHLTPDVREELQPVIVEAAMGWAITSLGHLSDDHWLTPADLARELGLTPSGIRNWQSRYGLKPVDGLYRWGDVQEIRKERSRRNTERVL